MDTAMSPRAKRVAATLRRLVRRGAHQRISNLLSKVRPEDLALSLLDFTPAEQLRVFRILLESYPEAAVDVLTELERPVRVSLLERLSPEQVGNIVKNAPVDDAVYLIESMPPELKEKILDLVDLGGMTEVQSHLTYEDDSAGRIMDTEFFSLPESTRVSQAVAKIQELQDVEMIFYLYVVDDAGSLLGVTSLRQLLLTRPEKTLGEIMQPDIIKVTTETDQEVVAQLAARYDLLAIPVTDELNHLVGIVTVDDIVDVVREEATEDFYKIVGTSDDELHYHGKAWRVAGIRLPWLFANMIGLTLTGFLLEFFQHRYESYLFLLGFVPLVMGMGGTTGSQTSTITVRGLATGRLASDARGSGWFVWHQVRVGLVVALCTAFAASAVALLRHQSWSFALMVAVALLVVIFIATLSGALVPLLFKRLGIDPAVAAGPLVTMSSDITGILVYFGLVALMFKFLLLV
jgi:magnesium transporter